MIKRHPYRSGNSVVISIPSYMLQECHIAPGKPVTISVSRLRNCPPVIIVGRNPADIVLYLPVDPGEWSH